jgi:antitoxin CcdA
MGRRNLRGNGRSIAALHRKSVNVTLPTALVAEARALGLNFSHAAQAGVAAAIACIRAEGWLAEGRLSLESSNAYVEQNGLPIVGLRRWDNVEC